MTIEPKQDYCYKKNDVRLVVHWVNNGFVYFWKWAPDYSVWTDTMFTMPLDEFMKAVECAEFEDLSDDT